MEQALRRAIGFQLARLTGEKIDNEAGVWGDISQALGWLPHGELGRSVSRVRSRSPAISSLFAPFLAEIMRVVGEARGGSGWGD